MYGTTIYDPTFDKKSAKTWAKYIADTIDYYAIINFTVWPPVGIWVPKASVPAGRVRIVHAVNSTVVGAPVTWPPWP